MTLMIRDAVPDDLGQVQGMMGDLARHHGDEATITLAGLHTQVFVQRRGRVLVAAAEEGLVGFALILARPNIISGGAWAQPRGGCANADDQRPAGQPRRRGRFKVA